MATLTYDPTPADQPEFNEAEQEALAIGEAQAEAEQQMYAGKFKDAEALEQAYIELQKKLGQTDEVQTSDEGGKEESPTEEEEVESSVFDTAAKEWNENGQLTDETIKALSEMDSSELVQAYIEAQNQRQPAEDLTQDQISQVYNIAGGEEQYQSLVKWAGENLPNEYVTAFDNLVETSDMYAIQLAVAGLQSTYADANGYEGRMLSGKSTTETPNTFRSQAEVVQAMADPRYDRDPAYRQDVFNKLERSNLSY